MSGIQNTDYSRSRVMTIPISSRQSIAFQPVVVLDPRRGSTSIAVGVTYGILKPLKQGDSEGVEQNLNKIFLFIFDSRLDQEQLQFIQERNALVVFLLVGNILH